MCVTYVVQHSDAAVPLGNETYAGLKKSPPTLSAGYNRPARPFASSAFDPPMENAADMPTRRGRAAATNPATRFDLLHIEPDPAALDADELRSVPTRFFHDHTRSVLAKNNSPDVGFTYSLNPYRGCEHGCIYCYARPSHEFLGFSAGLDFETKILVKKDAPRLLAEELARPSWSPQVVALSGNTDPYQPVERRLKLTRACLQVFLTHRNPVAVITKNHLITRDLDVLAELATLNLVTVSVSITSLRPDLVGAMEPRTSRPQRRLQAIERLAERGIPVGVNVAPVVPGLTDEEMPEILRQAASSGARRASYILLRLPGPVKDLFIEWLCRTLPDRADRVLNRLASLRGGRLSDNRFGTRMRGEGEWAEVLSRLFHLTCKRHGLNEPTQPLSTTHFRRLAGGQLDIFG